MTEKLNLSDDPTEVVLDPLRKYSTKEMKQILSERADAVYAAEKGKKKKKGD